MGLVTADDFRKAREFVDEAKEASDRLEVERQQAELEAAKQRRDNKRKVQQKALSFADDDEEEETVFVSRKKYTKNPTVDTSFLPDRERDSVLEQRRKELSEEWRIQQDNIKKEVRPPRALLVGIVVSTRGVSLDDGGGVQLLGWLRAPEGDAGQERRDRYCVHGLVVVSCHACVNRILRRNSG